MKKRYVNFTTEMGNAVQIDETLEVSVQVTGEVVLAGEAPSDEAVILPARWAGTRNAVLALRDSAGKR